MRPGTADLAPYPGTEVVLAALRLALDLDPEPGTGRGGPGTPWPAVVDAVVRHRVVGPVASVAHELGVPPPQAERLRALQLEAVRSGLSVAVGSRAVSRALREAGLRSLVVKGVALAAVQQRPLADRGTGDVDLWVRPAEVGAAIEVLRAHGWRPPSPVPPRLPGPGWRDRLSSWCSPETALVHDRYPDLDLHWRLLRSPAGLELDFDEAWERSVAVDELQGEVRTLAAEDALRHVAAHASKDGWPGLRYLVDVVRLARVLPPAQLAATAARHHQVGLALEVAGHLDPGLLRRGASTRQRQLAARAWQECLSTRLMTAEIVTMPGVAGRRLRRRQLRWQVVAAPSLRAAVHPVVEAVLPRGAIASPDPLAVALVRFVRSRDPGGGVAP
jgi:hypothetical protein